MYESPIELLVTDIQNQIVKQQDEEIYQAVLHYVPNVDKNELIRALQYDRQQYEKGYADGTPKWIPVTERLPEDDEQVKFSDDGRMRFTTVLAYTEYGRIIPKNRMIVRPTGIEYLDTQVTDGYIWGSGTEKVTHWMPLPEPPKGE